jgi:hypothetical protein
MHNTTFALVVLSLFTDADKAAEIEGDLLEQARRHGKLWFWLQVKLTCIALLFHSLRAETAKFLLYGYAVYELVLKFNWLVLNPLRASVRRGFHLDAAQFGVVNNLITVQVAFTLGMALVLLSPKHGSKITAVAAGFMIGRVALLDGVSDIPRLIAFALIPAVAGNLLMKSLELRNGGPFIPYASH